LRHNSAWRNSWHSTRPQTNLRRLLQFFVRPTIVLTPSVSLVGYFTHTYNYTPTDATVDIWNKQALNVGFVVDAKKLFFLHKVG
jgi:hypothetical protein